jgi:hypothetical protein
MQDFQDLEMAQCKKNSQQQFVTLLASLIREREKEEKSVEEV